MKSVAYFSYGGSFFTHQVVVFVARTGQRYCITAPSSFSGFRLGFSRIRQLPNVEKVVDVVKYACVRVVDVFQYPYLF